MRLRDQDCPGCGGKGGWGGGRPNRAFNRACAAVAKVGSNNPKAEARWQRRLRGMGRRYLANLYR